MAELEELKKNQRVYTEAVALLARENQELKEKMAQSLGAAHQHDEANSKAPEPNHDQRLFVKNEANPEPLNRRTARRNRSSDPDYTPEDSVRTEERDEPLRRMITIALWKTFVQR